MVEDQLGNDVGNIELRYGGRTLVITLYVNTDEDKMAVLGRIIEAAKGPKRSMVTATLEVIAGAVADLVWVARRTIYNDARRKNTNGG